MNAFHIKLLAMFFMIIDHVGMFFFPQFLLLRIIGRLSFPLFAWLIANGAYHTKNISRYFYRLAGFAVLSQIPFALANKIVDPYSTMLNIFFTLSLGLLAIIGIKKTSMHIHWVLISGITAAIAQWLNTDYGAFGVLMIVLFYIFYKSWKKLFIAQSLLFFCNSVVSLSRHELIGMIEIIGIFSIILIYFYNKKKGPSIKYLFYLFYPVQYIIIFVIRKYF